MALACLPTQKKQKVGVNWKLRGKSRRASGLIRQRPAGERKSRLSLRRRVLAAGRPAGETRGQMKLEFEGQGSLAVPAHAAIFVLFNDYTMLSQFSADAVTLPHVA